MKINRILFAGKIKGRIFTEVITTNALQMKNAITFNKIQAGKYQVCMNGLELVTIVRGSYNWTVYNQTAAFVAFYDKLDRYNDWLLDAQTYATKSELKMAYQYAANSIK